MFNKQVDQDLKYLSYWLNANKMCLNVSITEVVLFKSLRKQTETILKLKLNGKRLYTTDSVKYLGIRIDENLSWHQQINNVPIKLNRANAMLSKVRDFVDKIIQFFESHLFHSCLYIKALYFTKKSLQLMHFLNRNTHRFLKNQTY